MMKSSCDILGCIVWIYTVCHLGLCLENLALRKPALMTPYPDAEIRDGFEAVDGQTSTANWPNGVCAHTESGDPKPWVVVDLLQEYYILNISLTNRLDCCQWRTHDFIIDVFKTNPARCDSANGSVCMTYVGAMGNHEILTCDTPILGRFVRIWKPIVDDNNDVLNFCEMEVFGLPKDCGHSFISLNHLTGKRLVSSNMASHSIPSRVACVTECKMLRACVGGNYNMENGVCELLTRPEYDATVFDDPAWSYFGHDLC